MEEIRLVLDRRYTSLIQHWPCIILGLNNPRYMLSWVDPCIVKWIPFLWLDSPPLCSHWGIPSHLSQSRCLSYRYSRHTYLPCFQAEHSSTYGYHWAAG